MAFQKPGIRRATPAPLDRAIRRKLVVPDSGDHRPRVGFAEAFEQKGASRVTTAGQLQMGIRWRSEGRQQAPVGSLHNSRACWQASRWRAAHRAVPDRAAAGGGSPWISRMRGRKVLVVGSRRMAVHVDPAPAGSGRANSALHPGQAFGFQARCTISMSLAAPPQLCVAAISGELCPVPQPGRRRSASKAARRSLRWTKSPPRLRSPARTAPGRPALLGVSSPAAR